MARQYLEEALAQQPGRADIAAELGHLFHQWSVGPFASPEDYFPRAEEYFRQAQQINPDDVELLTFMGELQLDQGNTLDAERSLRKALAIDGRYVPALQGLAKFYMKVKERQRAKDAILHAVELDPEDTTSYFLLAQLLAQANRPEEAVRYAQKSELLDFGVLPERDLLLAKEYERLGDLKPALAYYERINRYAPNQAAVVVKIGELADRAGDSEKSAEFYQQAFKLDASLLDVWVDKGQTFLREEKPVEAILQFRRVLQIQPGNVQALHGLASAHFLNLFYQQVKRSALQQDILLFDQQLRSLPAGERDELIAMDQLKLAMASNTAPASQQAQGVFKGELERIAASNNDFAAGEALFLLGRYREAQERLDAVDGQTAKGYLQAADRLLLDQELVLANALYQRGYQMDPLPDIQQGLKRIQAKQKLSEQKISAGNQLYDAKRFAEAVVQYEQANRIYQEWEVPYLRLGDAYEKLHEKDKAGMAYRMAVQLNPALLDSKGFAKKYKRFAKGS
jgi:tetratricopeptide (TPR) repeat protein